MCGGVHGRTAWEIAEKEAQGSDAIFEATPERFTVQWNVLTARPGDLIQAGVLGSERPSKREPFMLVTFRVKRVYKGGVGPVVQVRTGMGGGDCGARYATGLDYLVYAYGAKPTELAVSLCSPGGWIGSNYLSTKLRYLRKERPAPTDLAKLDYWTPSAVARRDREREEFIKRYAAATGQICGVVSPITAGNKERTIAFLPTIGYSPYGASTAQVDREGKFCSERLGPGKYYLYFTQGPWNGELESALYYPGVSERTKASAFQVEAGEVKSGVAFRIPKQKAYAVHGFISVDDKTRIGKDGVVVMLVSPEGRPCYRQSIDFGTFFPLPKTKYFSFGNVLPGRYRAYAFGPGGDWLTEVVEVNVTTHAKLIFLALMCTSHANSTS
jgi:hypothetical protein